MTEREAYEMYDEMIDDGGLDNLNLPMTPSKVLQEIDPIQYDCGFTDFCDDLDIED